jgi:hypothetical protein
MKYLFLLFLLPLSASAQKAYIRHYKAAIGSDTTFTDTTGMLQVGANITINNTQYQATPGEPITDPYTGYIYTPYTLANGWTAIVATFSNLELERVTVQETDRVETYYCR